MTYVLEYLIGTSQALPCFHTASWQVTHQVPYLFPVSSLLPHTLQCLRASPYLLKTSQTKVVTYFILAPARSWPYFSFCYIIDTLSALHALSFSFYPGNGLVRGKKLHDVFQSQVE